MTDEKIQEEFFQMASRHQKLYQKSKKIGKQHLFLDFLNEENEGVRLWAASFSLNTNPEAALHCLRDLAKLATITSMQAELILKLWDKGELELF